MANRKVQARSLFDKVWERHLVCPETADAPAVIYIDLHLVHEVTSPQAFEGLQINQRALWRKQSIVAVPDHNVPTTARDQGISDPVARRAMTQRRTLANTVSLIEDL